MRDCILKQNRTTYWQWAYWDKSRVKLQINCYYRGICKNKTKTNKRPTDSKREGARKTERERERQWKTMRKNCLSHRPLHCMAFSLSCFTARQVVAAFYFPHAFLTAISTFFPPWPPSPFESWPCTFVDIQPRLMVFVSFVDFCWQRLRIKQRCEEAAEKFAKCMSKRLALWYTHPL